MTYGIKYVDLHRKPSAHDVRVVGSALEIEATKSCTMTTAMKRAYRHDTSSPESRLTCVPHT